MLFNSIEFLLFLPIVFLLYQVVCRTAKSQNWLIVVASYVFYGWWDWRFLLLIAFTTLCSYAGGLIIEHNDHNKSVRRIACVANVVVNLAVLAVFKYYNFFAESFADVLSAFGMDLNWSTLNIVLPVGISFYTFQALSYTIDVYRRQMPAEGYIVPFVAYISFFPQLVAGPIERAANLLPQFSRFRQFNYAEAVDGLRQMLWGFFKKIVVADNCAQGVDIIFGDYGDASSMTLLYGAVLFTFQIYADFSGYSDIAIGCAKLFGIKLMRNFNNPYLSVSMGEFWRRWHISLMSWFRDYVYIPLGGSRRGRLRTVRNTLAVFTLSGLWHGANWTFVTWGVYHALLLLPKAILGKKAADSSSMKPVERIVRRCMVFVFAVLGWILFRSESIADAWQYIANMFTVGGLFVPMIQKTLCAFIMVMMAVEYMLRDKEHGLQIGCVVKSAVARWAIYYAILVSIFWQAGTSTQFIYFQF